MTDRAIRAPLAEGNNSSSYTVQEILMPALLSDSEKATLEKWLVKEGDVVSAGDLLAEIETEKATMEFESAAGGVIGKLLIPEGTEGVKVGSPIAVLLGDGNRKTYTVKAWRVKLGDFVEEGDPVCDLSFEGGVVTVTSPAKGDIQNINRIEGQQAETGYVIGLVGFGEDKRASSEGRAALSSKEKSSKAPHALKYLFNGGGRQKLAIFLIAGLAVGTVKGVYNHFSEPSFGDLFGREMRAELERREGVSRSESLDLFQSLELSDLEELADFYFGLGQRDGALRLTEYFFMLSDENYSQGREGELWNEVNELVDYLSGLSFNELTEPVPLPSRFNNFGVMRDNRGNSATARGRGETLAEDASLLSLYRSFYVMVSGGRQHPSGGVESFNEAGIYFDIAGCEGIAPGYGRYTFSYDFSSALWETAELNGSSWRVECVGFCFSDDGGYQTRSMSFRVGSDLENFLMAALDIKDHCEDPERTRAFRLR